MRFIIIIVFLLLSGILPNKTQIITINTIFQVQLLNDNTTYIITKPIDLNNDTLLIPKNCTIKFRRKGRISNGLLVGDNTRIEGLSKIRFSNIQFDGSFITSNIRAGAFGHYPNDTELLHAMFDLLFFSSNQSELTLEAGKYYNVYCDNLPYAHAIFEYYGKNHKSIIGQGAIINDLRTRSQIGYKSYDGVFLFSGCNNISIIGLNYQNLNDDYFEIKDGNSVKFAAGIENQIGYVGTSFILLQDDCFNFIIESDIIGARYGIKSGDYSMFWLCGEFGIRNSVFRINAKRTGYPVAIEVGDSLNIFVHSEEHHRAAYLCGVTNSRISVEAKDIYIAPFHCLLSDTHFSKGDKKRPSYKSCSNVDLTITELGSTIATNGDCYCVGIQTYNSEPFFGRHIPLVWENITIKARKQIGSSKVGLFSLSRNSPSSHFDPLSIEDVFKNFHLYGEDPFETDQYGLRIKVNEFAKYENFRIILNAPYSSAIVDNGNDYEFDFSSSQMACLSYSGRIKYNKTQKVNKIKSSIKQYE